MASEHNHPVLAGPVSHVMNLAFISVIIALPYCALLHAQAGQQGMTARDGTSQADDVHRGDQLPITQDEDKQQLLALPAATTAFPHEFR